MRKQQGSTVLLVPSLGQHKNPPGTWERGKQVEPGKEPGDSGRASRERLLGGLGLFQGVLHQLLSSGGVHPLSPHCGLGVVSRGWIPPQLRTWDKWWEAWELGSEPDVMAGPSGVQFSGALKYSSGELWFQSWRLWPGQWWQGVPGAAWGCFVWGKGAAILSLHLPACPCLSRQGTEQRPSL